MVSLLACRHCGQVMVDSVIGDVMLHLFASTKLFSKVPSFAYTVNGDHGGTVSMTSCVKPNVYAGCKVASG